MKNNRIFNTNNESMLIRRLLTNLPTSVEEASLIANLDKLKMEQPTESELITESGLFPNLSYKEIYETVNEPGDSEELVYKLKKMNQEKIDKRPFDKNVVNTDYELEDTRLWNLWLPFKSKGYAASYFFSQHKEDIFRAYLKIKRDKLTKSDLETLEQLTSKMTEDFQAELREWRETEWMTDDDIKMRNLERELKASSKELASKKEHYDSWFKNLQIRAKAIEDINTVANNENNHNKRDSLKEELDGFLKYLDKIEEVKGKIEAIDKPIVDADGDVIKKPTGWK